MKEHDWKTIVGQIPSKSNQYRIVTIHGHGSLAKSKSLTEYEKSFYMQVGEYRNLGIDGFFEIYVRVYFSTMSHDIDNSLKCLLDCLQHAGTIKNDNRCVKVVAEKFIDKMNPRIEFRIVEV